jgi:ribosomal protein S18 acetylase RimI-like enzyme
MGFEDFRFRNIHRISCHLKVLVESILVASDRNHMPMMVRSRKDDTVPPMMTLSADMGSKSFLTTVTWIYRCFLVGWFVLAPATPIHAWGTTGSTNIVFRDGIPSDEWIIAIQMGKQLMNPLGIQHDRFVVAVALDASTTTGKNEKRIGWAQIRPLGNTKLSDPRSFNARPGSFNPQKEADEQIWEEFEDDKLTQPPTGFASLPWIQEYRDFAKSSVKRREKREFFLQQQREYAQQFGRLYELASVWVDPVYRKRGIGKQLVENVLQRHVANGNKQSDVYLLTLASTSKWYRENFGFVLVPKDQIPAPMALEVSAGSFITKLIGAELVCMRGQD